MTLALVVADGQEKQPAKKVEPKVQVINPFIAPAGGVTKLTVRGNNLDQAKEVKIAEGKGSVKILNKSKAPPPDKLPPEKFGDSQVEIELKIEGNAAPGPVRLTVVTPDGETPPYALLVEGAQAPLAEKEGNDGFRQAQEITLPAVIDGRIERPRDVDVFRFTGKAGQKISAEVIASRQGMALDPMLTLYNANGIQIAVSDDHGKSFDPRIETVLPADGIYHLSLIDAYDTGSTLHVYRLLVR